MTDDFHGITKPNARERFVFWLAERLGVAIESYAKFADAVNERDEMVAAAGDQKQYLEGLLVKEQLKWGAEQSKLVHQADELATILEAKFNDARMMTHSSMPNRETEAWWGGVTYACATVYEKLGKEVPTDITGLVARFSKIYLG